MEYQKITNISKNSQQNNLETVTNQNDKEIPKERYVSPEERQKIIDKFDISIIIYQKIKNLLDNTPNQPTKLSAKNWVEINGNVRGTYTDIRAW